MSFKISFLISFIIFIMFLISSKLFFGTEILILTKKGNFLNFQFDQNSLGIGKNQNLKDQISEEGKISEEIQKIQNKIKYPLYAIEEKLESSCIWEIQINQNKKASSIKLIKPCSHYSFEDEFMNVIKTWEFDLNEGTKFLIPVKFSLSK